MKVDQSDRVVTKPMRSSSRRVLVAASWIVLLVGVASLTRAWSHPTVFDANGGLGVTAGGWRPGDTVYTGTAGVADRETGTITIHSATAIPSPTKVSDVALYVCTKNPARADITIVTLGEEDVRDLCSTLTPAVGATMRLRSNPEQVLVVAAKVPPSGKVRIDGIKLGYSHGWQRGEQVVGVFVKVEPDGDGS